MTLNRAVYAIIITLVLILLLGSGVYLATPLLLNWQVNKLIQQQGCTDVNSEFQRPAWSQLRATEIQLSNCQFGIEQLTIENLNIGFDVAALFRQHRLSSITIERAYVRYRQPLNSQATDNNTASKNTTNWLDELKLPSQLLATLPLSTIHIHSLKADLLLPQASIQTQGSVQLDSNSLNIDATTTGSISPTANTTAARATKSTALDAGSILTFNRLGTTIRLDNNNHFSIKVTDEDVPFYALKGSLSLANQQLRINAKDQLNLAPAFVWIKRTSAAANNLSGLIEGQLDSQWQTNIPIAWALGKETAAAPMFQIASTLSSLKVTQPHSTIKSLAGEIGLQLSWQPSAHQSSSIKWHLTEQTQASIELSPEVMPHDALSAKWQLTSDQLAGSATWQMPWRVNTNQGSLMLASNDPNRLGVSALLSHLTISEKSLSSQFDAEVSSAKIDYSGVIVTQLKSQLKGLAALRDNIINLKLKKASYLYADQLAYQSLKLDKPKAAIVKPMDLQAEFLTRRWQLSPMELSLAAGSNQVLDFSAGSINGVLSIADNNQLSQKLSGRLNTNLNKLRSPHSQIGSINIDTPFTLSYPTLALRPALQWPASSSKPITLTSTLNYQLDQRRGGGSFTMPSTPLGHLVATPIFKNYTDQQDIALTAGSMFADGNFKLASAAEHSQWSVDLVAKINAAEGHFNNWFFNQTNASASASMTNQGLQQSSLQLSSEAITGPINFTDLIIDTVYQPQTHSLNVGKASVKTLGGTVNAQPFNVALKSMNTAINVDIENLELSQLVKLQTDQNITATGHLFGHIPLVINEGQPAVDFGYIAANEQGGLLAYKPPNAIQLARNPGMAIALNAMDNFHYNHLSAEVHYQADGTLWLDTALKGHNPNWQNGQPIDFNIRIEQNLLKLLQALQFSDNLSNGIDKKIRQRMK